MTVHATTSRKNQIAICCVRKEDRLGFFWACFCAPGSPQKEGRPHPAVCAGGGCVEQEKNLAEQVFSGFCFCKVIENKSKVKCKPGKRKDSIVPYRINDSSNVVHSGTEHKQHG